MLRIINRVLRGYPGPGPVCDITGSGSRLDTGEQAHRLTVWSWAIPSNLLFKWDYTCSWDEQVKSPWQTMGGLDKNVYIDWYGSVYCKPQSIRHHHQVGYTTQSTHSRQIVGLVLCSIVKLMFDLYRANTWFLWVSNVFLWILILCHYYNMCYNRYHFRSFCSSVHLSQRTKFFLESCWRRYTLSKLCLNKKMWFHDKGECIILLITPK